MVVEGGGEAQRWYWGLYTPASDMGMVVMGSGNSNAQAGVCVCGGWSVRMAFCGSTRDLVPCITTVSLQQYVFGAAWHRD